MNTSLQRLVATNGSGPSIGLELPPDNDWSPSGATWMETEAWRCS
jgi:hypothetical protein